MPSFSNFCHVRFATSSAWANKPLGSTFQSTLTREARLAIGFDSMPTLGFQASCVQREWFQYHRMDRAQSRSSQLRSGQGSLARDVLDWTGRIDTNRERLDPQFAVYYLLWLQRYCATHT